MPPALGDEVAQFIWSLPGVFAVRYNDLNIHPRGLGTSCDLTIRRLFAALQMLKRVNTLTKKVKI